MDPRAPRDSHPDDATLQRLVTGELADAEARVVEAHLEARCSQCWDRIKALPRQPVPDTLYALIQQASASPGPSIPTPPEHSYRFTVVGLHAKGGLGQVFVARDADLERQVALKQMRPERVLNPRNRARFLREAQITGQLEHPGIVPIYELGTRSDNQQPYYAMRLIQGKTLRAAIREFHHGSPVSPDFHSLKFRELLQQFAYVCNTLAYAHSKGIIHRDLKPDNIVLGDFGEVIVLDWGLAKKLASGEATSPTAETAELPPADSKPKPAAPGLTSEGEVAGTPSYMAPEQAAGDAASIKDACDVYGLGAILYELLSDHQPFVGASAEEIVRRVRDESPTPVREHCAAVPRALAAICAKAMERSPSDRYASARLLGDDVSRWLADQPVSVFRDPLLARAGRWARRHRLAVTAAAALLVTALPALIVTTILVTLEQQQTERAKVLTQHEAARADQNFRHAREAVDKYFTQISESTLLRTPGAQKLRAELLESARVFYERFVAENANDSQLEAELARSWYRLGTISHEIASPAQARPYFERALLIQENRVNLSTETGPRNDLAATLHDLGKCHLDEGNLDDAERRVAAALDWFTTCAEVETGDERARFGLRRATCLDTLGSILERRGKGLDAALQVERAFLLRKRALESPALRRAAADQLAISMFKHGNLHYEAQLWDRADEYYSQALAVFEDLLRRDDQHNLFWRECHAKTLHNQAMVQEALANLAKARSLHEQALAVRRKHSVENPDVPEYQSDLAQSLNALSLLEYHHGRLAEAEAFGRQALAIRKSLHEKHPAVLLHAQDLAESMHNLGIILEDLNRDAESQAIYKQTVELLRQLIAKHSDVPQLRAELAATLHDAAQSGQPDREALLQESLKLRRELSAAYPHRSGWATVVAQSLESLAGLHEQKQPAPDLTQATRLLEEAIAIRKRLSGDSLRRQVELGWAHTMLGQVLLMQQRFPDARQHLDDGLRLIKPAAERPDASARDRRWYAATLAYRADLHLYQQEWDAALTNAEAAVRAYSPLAERGTPDQRNLLGQMHQRRSGALFKLNRTEDALKAIESAISLLQGGSKVQAEVFLAVTHAQLGDYRKATTLATALSKRTDLRAGDWFNVACTFGIAHQKAAKDSKLHAEERARLQLEWTMGALVALEEAAKRGFFRGPGGAQHLADGDLAPFVEESRFQKLKASAGG